MKLYSTFFNLFLFIPMLVGAQVPEPAMVWLKGYGGNAAEGVASSVYKTNDGGFIVTFGSNSNLGTGNIDSLCSQNGRRTIFVNDATGTEEWTKCYSYVTGDTSLGYCYPSDDDGIVFGGSYISSVGWGFYLAKHDATGNIIWKRSYSKGSGIILRSMIQTVDGYIMVGEATDIDTNFNTHYGGLMNADIGILKVDTNGNKIWSKVIGGTGDERVWCVVPGPANGCYIIGTTPSNDYDCAGNHGGSSGSTDAYLARLDANGTLIWHKDLGGIGYDQGNYGYMDGKGGIIMGATSGSNDGDVTHQINAGGYNIWAINIDSNGTITWDRCYGGGGNEFTNSICKASDGSIWIAGTKAGATGLQIDTAYGNWDAYFVHSDSLGNFLSAKVVGSSAQEEAFLVYPLSNGNVIAGGYYSNSDGFVPTTYYGGTDAFLAMFTPWTTAIKQLHQLHNLVTVYPNPAYEEITIESENVTGNYQIVISDLAGRKVYSNNMTGTLNVHVNSWTKGMYYIQVSDEHSQKFIQKLIIQ